MCNLFTKKKIKKNSTLSQTFAIIYGYKMAHIHMFVSPVLLALRSMSVYILYFSINSIKKINRKKSLNAIHIFTFFGSMKGRKKEKKNEFFFSLHNL